MNARKGGWRVIKTLTADDVRSIRTRELRGAAEAHAAIGEPGWAAEYARRADELAAEHHECHDDRPSNPTCALCNPVGGAP